MAHMKISELLRPECIDLNAHCTGKEEAISRLLRLMSKSGAIKNEEEYRCCVWEREAMGSTGVGDGIAIPHAKSEAVDHPALCAMVVRHGVEFDSLDQKPAYLFFLIAAPSSGNWHLEVLSRLSLLLMEESFRKNLLEMKTAGEFLEYIDRAERERAREAGAEAGRYAPEYPAVLAVTACPTGIAHTYMAAQRLREAAGVSGVSIKVETNGATGIQDPLSSEEIAACRGIIVAADIHVEMERFSGRPVLHAGVSEGIQHPGELIEEIFEGKVPVYQKDFDCTSHMKAGRANLLQVCYQHLMNGISHMLPFVIGGGILVALAYLADSIFAPGGGAATLGMNSTVGMYLKTIGQTAFDLMLPVLAGFIAMSIAERPGLAAGFVGGVLSVLGSTGFLGAILAGFLSGYLTLGIKKLFEKPFKLLEGIKPVLIYPLFSILITGCCMLFLLDPPLSALNRLVLEGLGFLSQNLGFGVVMGMLLGGMMSVDMGGPVNKAAYVFGTASLLSADGSVVCSGFMAAVMAGGMAPPLIIALCATLFKTRFTKRERQAALPNYVMGLSFITEGAIPFVAADPFHVFPPCILGSALAGGLSMLFGCKAPAPHGGIFAIAIMDNPLWYLVALTSGVVAGALLLAVLKRPEKVAAEGERQQILL